MLSDTPRTDAVASDGWSGDAVCVDAEFARGLERELSAMKKDTARLDFLERCTVSVGALFIASPPLFGDPPSNIRAQIDEAMEKHPQ